MPQIVNLNCSVCNQRIECDLEGEFCPACGGPVHQNCRRLTAPTAERCGTCGGILAHPIGIQNRKEKEIADREAEAKLRKAKEAPTRKFVFNFIWALSLIGTFLVVGALIGIMTLLVGPPPH
jgi:hypothetical protein